MLFTMLTRTAAEHGLEHAFMQVVGPLCERDLADRSSVPVVEKSRGGLLVWQQGGTQLGLAQLLVSQYVPPDSALASSHQPTKKRLSPTMAVFVQEKSVNLCDGPWTQVVAEPSVVLPVLCRGLRVGEMQVKYLAKEGFLQPDPENPLLPHERCGALVATEGGRVLSLDPHAFIQDRRVAHAARRHGPRHTTLAMRRVCVQPLPHPLQAVRALAVRLHDLRRLQAAPRAKCVGILPGDAQEARTCDGRVLQAHLTHARS